MSDEAQAAQGSAAAAGAIRGHVGDLAAALPLWDARDDTRPDAHARRAASGAVDAIDAALAGLHAIRARLITEIHASDDATAIRADALLARTDDATTSSSDQASLGQLAWGNRRAGRAVNAPAPAKGNADEQE
jgi:hypothetical protein